MTISLTEAGKRFNREWIFRRLSYEFRPSVPCAIVGPNGSGKSTLLQILSGALTLNEGRIRFALNGSDEATDPAGVYRFVSLCAPYLELVEEMTLREFLEFHQGFKSFLPGITGETIIQRIGLENAATKQIRHFSSGMKQRVKLAQAIFSNSEALLLDEPCTNLDAAGVEMYGQLIADYSGGRLVIVSSNDPQEYRFCREQIDITKWK
ncbi:MAG TPA: ATP-binding cassette domain-containing protein [Chitinophagaceae bacterium]|nr:ATP-binding cassette domain-containing protein [Chitinophagaceae bacterium]